MGGEVRILKEDCLQNQLNWWKTCKVGNYEQVKMMQKIMQQEKDKSYIKSW